MSNSIYNWVTEMTGLTTTEYSSARCDFEKETLIAKLLNEITEFSGYASFSGNDLLLWNKGVACLIVDLLGKRGSVSFNTGNIIAMSNSGDSVRFEASTASHFNYIDEAWDYLKQIVAVKAVYDTTTYSAMYVKGQRRVNRVNLSYEAVNINPLYSIITDANTEYRFGGEPT